MSYLLETSEHLQTRALADYLASPTSTQITHEEILPFRPGDWIDPALFMPEGDLFSVMTSEGEWILQPSEADLYSLKPDDADKVLAQTLNPIQRAAQQSLEVINWFGYNDHGPNHIDMVTTRTKQLLDEAGCDEQTVTRGIIAARGHDLGNLISRDIHGFISPYILERAFPKVHTDEESWTCIRQAMELHDSVAFTPVLKHIAGLPFTEKVDILRPLFKPEGLALILADKTELGRHRVARKARSAQALEEHRHSRMDLYIGTTNIGYDSHSQTFEWNLAFNPMVDLAIEPDLTDLVDSSTINGTVGRLRRDLVPAQNDAVGEPLSEFNIMTNLVLGMLTSRIQLAMLSAFALYPDAQQLLMKFTDNETGRERNYTITPENLDEIINYFKKQYGLKKSKFE